MDGYGMLGVASVISAFIGPLVGVAIAHSLQTKEMKRRELADTFRSISENAIQFANAISSLAYHNVSLHNVLASNRQEESEPGVIGRRLPIDSQQYIDGRSEAAAKLGRTAAPLLADKLQVKLIVGEKAAAGCCQAIDSLLRLNDEAYADSITETIQRSNAAMAHLTKEMEKLHSTFMGDVA